MKISRSYVQHMYSIVNFQWDCHLTSFQQQMTIVKLAFILSMNLFDSCNERLTAITHTTSAPLIFTSWRILTTSDVQNIGTCRSIMLHEHTFFDSIKQIFPYLSIDWNSNLNKMFIYDDRKTKIKIKKINLPVAAFRLNIVMKQNVGGIDQRLTKKVACFRFFCSFSV